MKRTQTLVVCCACCVFRVYCSLAYFTSGPVITHLLTAYSRIVVRSCHSLKSPHLSRTQRAGVTRRRTRGVESAASHPSESNDAQKERRHEGASPDRST